MLSKENIMYKGWEQKVIVCIYRMVGNVGRVSFGEYL